MLYTIWPFPCCFKQSLNFLLFEVLFLTAYPLNWFHISCSGLRLQWYSGSLRTACPVLSGVSSTMYLPYYALTFFTASVNYMISSPCVHSQPLSHLRILSFGHSIVGICSTLTTIRNVKVWCEDKWKGRNSIILKSQISLQCQKF